MEWKFLIKQKLKFERDKIAYLLLPFIALFRSLLPTLEQGAIWRLSRSESAATGKPATG